MGHLRKLFGNFLCDYSFCCRLLSSVAEIKTCAVWDTPSRRSLSKRPQIYKAWFGVSNVSTHILRNTLQSVSERSIIQMLDTAFEYSLQTVNYTCTLPLFLLRLLFFAPDSSEGCTHLLDYRFEYGFRLLAIWITVTTATNQSMNRIRTRTQKNVVTATVALFTLMYL